jgi:hypothetical protein
MDLPLVALQWEDNKVSTTINPTVSKEQISNGTSQPSLQTMIGKKSLL